MITADLTALLKRLNDHATALLESAVGLCISRGHYEVRWEHFLSACLAHNDVEIMALLQRFEVDSSLLQAALNHDLEAMRTGNTGKPSFALPLLESFELAFAMCSLNYQLTAIAPGPILIAVLDKGLAALSGAAELLQRIDLSQAKREYRSMVRPDSANSTTLIKNSPDNSNSVLDQFCTDVTQQARDGKIDTILGRDDEIRQTLDILNRRRKNNPILVGEAGVGKTAIVEGLALRIAGGDVPDQFKNTAIYTLDLGLLQAGASVKGEFEKRLKAVIDAVMESVTPAILFIDEAHTLIGAGGAAGTGDAANLLKPALARGALRTIAATTWSEYRKYFEKDPALTRRFQVVKIDEPDTARAITMLRGVAALYEKHHQVVITDNAVVAAVSLSQRYITGRQLPDKAVDVLDTACGRVRMSQCATPALVDSALRALDHLKLELSRREKDHTAGLLTDESVLIDIRQRITDQNTELQTISEKWEAEKNQAALLTGLYEKIAAVPTDNQAERISLSVQLNQAQAQLSAIAGESPMVFPFVNSAVCAQVVADWSGVPVSSLRKNEATALLELEGRLQERVLGQDEALCAIADAVRSAKSGLGNPDAPLGVFIFCGPSGVGKTELAMALADQLFGGEAFATIINMSEYQEKHTVSQLKGSPPGYVGFGEGGILTEAVRQKPYSIVILDEVEKAHLEVMNLFYQVFDKGFMRDGEGREIDFRNTLIIMTSNLGSATIMDAAAAEDAPDAAALIELIRPELSAHFKPALLGRCTIIPFVPLSLDVMKGVVALKLDRLAQRLMQVHHIAFSCDPKLVEHIATSCTAAEAGARNADAIIRNLLLKTISQTNLSRMQDESAPISRLHAGLTESGEFELIVYEKQAENH